MFQIEISIIAQRLNEGKIYVFRNHVQILNMIAYEEIASFLPKLSY